MHVAWYIGEIQCEIFGYLERGDLVRLAQCSQSFFDIATDEIWRTLTVFEPLLRCFPSDYAERPLHAKDIERLDLYTSKVHHLSLEGLGNETVMKLPATFNRMDKSLKGVQKTSWKELWEEVATIRPASESFCNLRTIHVNHIVEELLRPLIGISGVRLTNIYIKHFQERQKDSVIRQILDGFQDSMDLEYLFVRDGEIGYIPQGLIRRAPLMHVRLDPPRYSRRKIAITKDASILSDVLQKPALEHLTIGLHDGWCKGQNQDLKQKILPALKSLSLDLTRCRVDSGDSGVIDEPHDGILGWKCGRSSAEVSAGNTGTYPNQSPVTFLEKLNAPELLLLNVKFPVYCTGSMLLDFVSAVKTNCRLNNLANLALTGGGAEERSMRFYSDNKKITSAELWLGLRVLLPLPGLRFLRLSVAPRLLDVLDLDLYRSIAEGIPALETLWLGHLEFSTMHPLYKFEHEPNPISRYRYKERVPLGNLAAFCKMFPNLVDISVGSVRLDNAGTSPDLRFVCTTVKTVRLLDWYHSRSSYYTEQQSEKQRARMHDNVQKYFPNARQERGLLGNQSVFENGSWKQLRRDKGQ